MRVFLIFIITSITSLHAQVGSITGTVPLSKSKVSTVPVGKYRGKISGKLSSPPPAIAGVWLESKSLSAPKTPTNITLSQQNYQFAKHLIIISKGATVFFPNEDPDYHNIYSLSRPKRFDIGRYKKGETPIPQVTFEKTGYIGLNCEIHSHMKANIIVVDSPHLTTTDTNGKFTLKNVPPGQYTLHAQMDAKTKWKATVVVGANQVTPVQFTK